jgi:hypothetical protein
MRGGNRITASDLDYETRRYLRYRRSEIVRSTVGAPKSQHGPRTIELAISGIKRPSHWPALVDPTQR